MSKAVVGALEIAGALALTALAGPGGFAALGMIMTGAAGATGYGTAVVGLLASGVATEAGAIAHAIGGNQGIGITTRQAAGYRQIIRGTQRTGGTIVFCSTTGSSHRQYNMVIVLATHVIDSIVNLYLDGRQVFWNTSSDYNQTRNGFNFGGNADSAGHVGPDGRNYNFGGKVFCAAFFGDQDSSPTVVGGTWVGPGSTAGFCSALEANDGSWTPSADGTPYLAGCAYVYLKIEADSATFPQLPEIRFTIRGKNDIYDPRTATTGYTENWALHVADAIADPKWGLNDGPITSWSTAAVNQLIAAANVCDESVACAAGYEKRYALHCCYDTSMPPGEVVAKMMEVAAGRLVSVGGEKRFIFPAYWQGPSLTFGPDDLTAQIQWTPKRALSELVNRVSGKYTAANYPYNAAGDMYDSNGYYMGTTENRFPFGFQPSDFPAYAADELQGYGTGVDIYLAEDGGIPLPLDLDLTWCLSVSQAQRVAKIRMLRNRHQGTGVFPMKAGALAAMGCDVMQFSLPALGWTNKVLEIDGPDAIIARVARDDKGIPSLTCEVKVRETDASIYEWADTEELTPYDVPVLVGGVSAYSVLALTGISALSDLTTALVQPDGTVTPRLKVWWDESTDTYVTAGGSIMVQMCAHGSAAWETVQLLDGQAAHVYIGGIVSGQTYDVRIAARRATGAQSDWTELDNIGAGIVVGAAGMTPVAPVGTLSAFTVDGTTAYIRAANFTAHHAGFSAACVPSPTSLLVHVPGQTWYVYYVDASFAGGTIAPIATQNTGDFLGLPGYYLIGSIVPPNYSVSYKPSAFADFGSYATLTPENLYAGGSGSAMVEGYWQTWNTTGLPGAPPPDIAAAGTGIWQGFPAQTLSSSKNLHINAAVTSAIGAGSFSVVISAIINGTTTTLATLTASHAATDYTVTVPSGTDMSTVYAQVSASVSGGAAPGTPGTYNEGNVQVTVSEISIR